MVETITESSVIDISFSDKRLSEVSRVVERIENNKWLQYAVLFDLMGFDLSSALMAVPFLKKDQHLNIPFIRKVRFNNLDGDTDPDHFLELASLLPDFDLRWADVTKHIPLPDQSADFFVINQGAVVSALDKMIIGLGGENHYPSEVHRVMKSGGLAMAYDYNAAELEPLETPSYIAHTFGLHRVNFQFPKSFIALLGEKTNNKQADSFENLFVDPHNTPVAFFIK